LSLVFLIDTSLLSEVRRYYSKVQRWETHIIDDEIMQENRRPHYYNSRLKDPEISQRGTKWIGYNK
jgi:hypothetical protein